MASIEVTNYYFKPGVESTEYGLSIKHLQRIMRGPIGDALIDLVNRRILGEMLWNGSIEQEFGNAVSRMVDLVQAAQGVQRQERLRQDND